MPPPLRLVACLLLALAVVAVRAQPGTSVYLEELTWTEVRDRVREGTTTVIVPAGGTEQNGPAMVLGKHNVRVRALAGRIAAGVGRTLVAPVLAYVPEGPVQPPAAHMRFAGTLTVPDDVFERTLESAARSLKQHGFRDIVLIADHGGTQKHLVHVADRLNRAWAGDGARVHALQDYYRAFEVDWAELLRHDGFGAAEIGVHAGLADTALALAVDPQLVRTDRLGAGLRPADGVTGDPSRASAAIGQRGADLIVGRSIDALRRALARR